MNMSRKPGKEGLEGELARKIGRKETRKMRARGTANRGVWYGLGMFGIVGWSVAIPAVAFLALGIWIDSTWPSRFSWTLMLLVTGVAVGCLNAWHWVKKEGRKE